MVSDRVTGHDVGINGSFSNFDLCLPCATGASCAGLQVNVLEEYWRGPDMHCPDAACAGSRGCDPRECYRQDTTTITREDDSICPVLTGMTDAQRRHLMSMNREDHLATLRAEFRRVHGHRRDEERLELGNPGIIGECPEGTHCRLKATIHICPLGACPGQTYRNTTIPCWRGRMPTLSVLTAARVPCAQSASLGGRSARGCAPGARAPLMASGSLSLLLRASPPSSFGILLRGLPSWRPGPATLSLTRSR